MATTYSNAASVLSLIGGINVTINSNGVVATLADTLTAVKSQAFDLVVSGTVQTYTVVISSTNLVPILLATFTDIIPTGMSLVTGTFKVNGVVTVPVVVGQTITYIIPSIPAGGSVTITFNVLVA